MLLRGTTRTIKCHIESSTQEPLSGESLVLPWLVEHAGCILSRMPKRVVTGRRPLKDCTARNRHKVWRESAGKANYHRSNEQNESLIPVRNLAWDAKQQRIMLHWECRSVYSELAKSEEWNFRADETQKPSTV